MKKIAKWATIILIIGLIFAGLGAAFGGVRAITYDHGFHIIKTQTQSKQLGRIDQVKINSGAADVTITQGKRAAIKVQGDVTNAAKIRQNDGTLTVNQTKDLPHIGFGSDETIPQIKLTLPKRRLAQLNLSLDSGNLKLQNITTQQLYLDLNGNGFTANQLKVTGNGQITTSGGDVKLTNTTLTKVDSSSSFGNISINNSHLNQSKLSSDDGDIEIENSRLTGITTLATDNGDIALTNSDSTGYHLRSKSGDIHFRDRTQQSSYLKHPTAANRIKATAQTGDIKIE
uniref:DUF4097 domain-containing protein n=1 Tax=Loigolactobacillus rennini TaxID=238013 RepID=A0A1K2I4P1_9LACO|nr:hypothetical protein LREN565_0457 [Loigolactobacillus rennini]